MIDFKKRFSFGLTLDANIEDYEKFLHKYNEYIYEIFFSLPLGNKFQTRSTIINQFKDPRNRNLLWKILSLTSEYDIKLQLVLNTPSLTKKDISLARSVLDDKGITVYSISIIDSHYDTVKSLFPECRIIYSYNNNIRTEKDYIGISNVYDDIVIGNTNLRSNSFLRKLKEAKYPTGIILLLDNGCSHNCTWCFKNGDGIECRDVFDNNLKNVNDINHLYALQSILPYEIHDGLIDDSLIHIYKLSTRSTSLTRAELCIDSYIHNICKDFIDVDPNNYRLWCKLSWFGKYVHDLNLSEILMHKQKIYDEMV